MSDDRVSVLPLYISPRRGARLVGALFLLTAALGWTAAGYRLAEIQRIAEIQQGQAMEPAEHIAYGIAGEMLMTTQLVMGGILAAAFLPWLFRARVNVRALGMRRLRFGRQWTVFGFLVPVLNFFRPYQVVREIWRASDPSGADPVAWRNVRASPLVLLWWSTLLGFIGLQLASSLLQSLATGLPRIALAHLLGLAASVCAALSASFGFVLVARISRAQDAKRALYRDDERRPPRPVDPRDESA